MQAARTHRIDPYFAFRLGVLGQMVADAVAPMGTAAPDIRQRYFKDAERYIQRVQMNSSNRRLIDATYFPERTRSASAQDDTIEVDYISGAGFGGLDMASLSDDASRAVNAVADVIYTIIVSPVSRLNVSQSDQRQYALDALRYYLERRKLSEADAAIGMVFNSGVLTPALEEQVADVYFESGHFERAMKHYESVLQADPTQRDVAARISTYYEEIGDTATQNSFLEDARDAYQKAADADSLNENAHRKLFNAERAIEARDVRLEASKAAIDLAREYESEAENARLKGNYIESMARLREAHAQYATVTDEFPELSREAGRGIRMLEMAVKEMQTNLVGSVRRLSGSGYPYTARRLGRTVPGGEERAFRSLQQIELNTAMENLAESVGRDIEALR